MSSLGDTISFSIAGFIIFVSFTLALFQNVGMMDQNNHFMSTSNTMGKTDSQVKELVNSSSTGTSTTSEFNLLSLGYLFITTVIGGLYNAVIGLSGWLVKFYVPPIMAAGIQVAIDGLFAYDLFILWRQT